MQSSLFVGGRSLQSEPILHHFGKRLRAARRGANLSQGALAKRLGLGQDTISHYEKARYMPNLLTVFQLSQILAVDVRYFFPQDEFTAFAEEERETLALLSSLSPAALQYVLSFVRYFAECQQRRRFLTQEVFNIEDPQTRFLMFLERDLHYLEEGFASHPKHARIAPMHALIGFTSILLMGIELEKADVQSEDLVRRIAASGNRLVALVRDFLDSERSGAKS
jgi:transcriptional regulator with XRE-family HTH domain